MKSNTLTIAPSKPRSRSPLQMHLDALRHNRRGRGTLVIRDWRKQLSTHAPALTGRGCMLMPRRVLEALRPESVVLYDGPGARYFLLVTTNTTSRGPRTYRMTTVDILSYSQHLLALCCGPISNNKFADRAGLSKELAALDNPRLLTS